jgi:DNA-binding transcriptional ArsR family regulator
LLNAAEETELEYSLRGKAWKVYWFLLKTGHPVSVREVQRALRFSSPSVANHHLEQLRELGLVQKQDIGGHYLLVSEVKIGVLRHYVKLGRLLFPRYFFYGLFSTVFYMAYLLFLMQGFTRENLFITAFGAIVCAVFWYEAYRVWSMRPF